MNPLARLSAAEISDSLRLENFGPVWANWRRGCPEVSAPACYFSLFFGTGPWPAHPAGFLPRAFFNFWHRALAGPHRRLSVPGPPSTPTAALFSFCGYCSTGHFFSIVACLPFLELRFKWHIYKHPRLVSPIRG